MCVCVFGRLSAKKKKERRREMSERMVAWKYESMHGRPLNKNQLAHTKSTPPSLWAWAENGEGREEIFGLFALKPML